jgi:hypothetical protein
MIGSTASREDPGQTPSSMPLQAAAWELCNASYQTPAGAAYREAGLALYRAAWHERIASVFARLDEQNRRLDAVGVR